ncbi:hypothetical protein [Sulfuracidifex tepidarius]|uniref:Uncharacterized protein n=1 Tax=Sulfuracidifex tepidarius TaxID=1294262 RepID=A0A510E4C2_9CREN|nr:hypothetical protein [Sulfuracidifex tepidarius]BBG24594.1 hypothetical protein IC006_1923 [Sulfuracidifex tepidarius]BBG27382.1 hypothetical protein IC007_1931 [Sulfuracidifex tepidarius]
MKDLEISIALMVSSLPIAELNVVEALLLPSIYILIRMIKIVISTKN